MPWACLFPKNGKGNLVDLYADWRDKHHTWWFKKWFRKPRRKLVKKGGGMKPFTLYHVFPEAFAALQQPLVDIIVKAAKPDRIFLLGASAFSPQKRKHLSAIGPHRPAYFPLLCTDPAAGPCQGKELHEWQDKIENHCRALLPVTTMVLQRARFEEWLTEGHPFATAVQQQAVVLYHSGTAPLPEAAPARPGATGQGEEKQWREGLEKAEEFLTGSELYRLRKQYTLAAFMLHQSAEQALRILLERGTGYYANTHSIERLLLYASLVSYQLPDLFPRQTEREKRLFTLLQKAYIDTRYKEYKINEEELVCLTGKVRRIHEIVCNVGKRTFHTPVSGLLKENF